jgi:hypothetical protein
MHVPIQRTSSENSKKLLKLHPYKTTFVHILQQHDTVTLTVVTSVSSWCQVWSKYDISFLVLFEWTHKHI